MQIWFDGLFRDFFLSLFVDLPYLHLLPAYKVMRLFSLSQYEIIVFYVLTLWTVRFCWCKKREKATLLSLQRCLGMVFLLHPDSS